ncbi:MAG: hypothetical protein L0Y56_06000 [Nitrospira sp.]|nr:hypothetical protein [Nitrospira sp.]
MREVRVFDKPQNVKRLLTGFYLFIGLLIVLDLFLSKHPVFLWERYPAFYGAYGFVAYVSIVLGSHYVLRKLFGRKEGYYDL